MRLLATVAGLQVDVTLAIFLLTMSIVRARIAHRRACCVGKQFDSNVRVLCHK